MKNVIHLKEQIIFVCLCAGLVLCWNQQLMAQYDRISISVSGGAGYLPLKDWKDFAASASNSHFDKERFGSYLDFRITYHLTGKHAVSLSVEGISTSASLYKAMVLTGEYGETLGYASSVTAWDFSAIPIGISYEFYPMQSEEKVFPFFGAGGSYFFSKVKGKSWFLQDRLLENLHSEGSRDGEGYGIHLYVGVQSALTEHLLVLSRLRGRYADGMAFTDKKGDVKVEFTGIDFTLGIGWRF